MRRFLLALGLVLLLAACAADPPQPEDPAQLTSTYTHPGGVFSLRLPPSWIAGDLSAGPALVMTFAPPEADRALLTVYVVRYGRDLTDDMYGAAMGGFLRGRQNERLAIVDQTALGDGSWRVTGIRRVRQEAIPVNVFMQRDGPYFSVLEVVVPAQDSFTSTLLTMIANSYTVNPAADWLVADVNALPALDEAHILSAGNMSFSGLHTWVDAQGAFHITGQVANRAPYLLEDVGVRAVLLDAAGATLAEAAAAVPVPVLLDGELAPFDVVFPDGWPRGAMRYRLLASGDDASDVLTVYSPEGFDWEDRAEYDSSGRLHIRGTVWNTGAALAQDIRAVITVFDAADRAIGYVAAPLGEGSLAAGDSARFDVPLPAVLGGEPVRYQMALQARRSD